MKKTIKTWWFWVIISIICIMVCIAILYYVGDIKTEDSMSNIGKGATDFIEGIDNAKSHLNEFSYNYEKSEVEYKPLKITLEMYNRITEGMSQDEAVSILGQYEDILNGEDTYILEWGNEYAPVYDGYWIQITFNTNEKRVLKKHQFGLE